MRERRRSLQRAVLLVCLMSGAHAGLACDRADLLLCDTFEGRAVGDPPNPELWSLQLGAGSSIAIDNAHAVSGQHAARIAVMQDRQWAYMQNKSIFPVAENGFWGRLSFRIDAERPKTEGLVHWNLIEAMADSDPIRMYRYGGISVPELGRNYFNWNHEMRPRPDGFSELSQDDDLNARVDPGQWHCVEWQFDGLTNTSRFFWDGIERDALTVIGEAGGVAFDMRPFRALNIGFTLYQPIQQDYVVWIDDVAVDRARIGCPS